MARYTADIPPEVRAILKAGTIGPNAFVLPPGQLDRQLYTSVNKVLEACGGKWDRRAGTHVGAGLGDKLRTALAVGKAVHHDKVAGFFATPLNVASRVCDLARVQPSHTVLEPSAGRGDLVAPLGGTGDGLVLVEKDGDRCEFLRRRFPSAEVIHADFLNWVPFAGGAFDRIVMNPPFNGRAHLQHLKCAVAMLRIKGRLVAVVPAGFHIDEIGGVPFTPTFSYHPLPERAFKGAGTSVNTRILTLDRM